MYRRVFHDVLIIIFKLTYFIYAFINIILRRALEFHEAGKGIQGTKLYEDHYGSGPKRLDGRMELNWTLVLLTASYYLPTLGISCIKVPLCSKQIYSRDTPELAQNLSPLPIPN